MTSWEIMTTMIYYEGAMKMQRAYKPRNMEAGELSQTLGRLATEAKVGYTMAAAGATGSSRSDVSS